MPATGSRGLGSAGQEARCFGRVEALFACRHEASLTQARQPKLALKTRRKTTCSTHSTTRLDNVARLVFAALSPDNRDAAGTKQGKASCAYTAQAARGSKTVYRPKHKRKSGLKEAAAIRFKALNHRCAATPAACWHAGAHGIGGVSF